jgi:microcystin-dependent protein
MALDKFKVKKDIETTSENSSSNLLIPTGTIALWPMNTVPDGWVECNAQELAIGTSGSQYNALYVAITNNGASFPYGANTNGSGGAGSTHFRVPDLEGRIAIGAGSGSGLTSRTLGDWAGTESVTITDNITSHIHTMAHTHTMSHIHTSPGHNGDIHYPAGATHTHPMGDHAHTTSGPGSNPHQHNAYFGNTGAPGSTFRNQSSAVGAATHTTAGGDHTHGLAPGGTIGNALNDFDTSGASSSEATGSGGTSTGGPSQTSSSPYSGPSTTISVVQKSYVLKYIMKV